MGLRDRVSVKVRHINGELAIRFGPTNALSVETLVWLSPAEGADLMEQLMVVLEDVRSEVSE